MAPLRSTSNVLPSWRNAGSSACVTWSKKAEPPAVKTSGAAGASART